MQAYTWVLRFDDDGDRRATASYNPTIWRFDGAVERLAHVTVSPGYLVRAGEDVPGAGTIGIAPDHVEFLRPGSCLVSHKSSSGDEDAVDRAFVRGAGRKPDVSIAPIGMEFTVPSGTMTKARSYKPSQTYEWEPGGRLHESENRYSDPDDVVSIDPANVFAPDPVERYVVLPNYFGLRQLVAEGKLERTENGYKIIQPITHFPADTDARFILPEGITLPTGEWMYAVIIEQRYVE